MVSEHEAKLKRLLSFKVEIQDKEQLLDAKKKRLQRLQKEVRSFVQLVAKNKKTLFDMI